MIVTILLLLYFVYDLAHVLAIDDCIGMRYARSAPLTGEKVRRA